MCDQIMFIYVCVHTRIALDPLPRADVCGTIAPHAFLYNFFFNI